MLPDPAVEGVPAAAAPSPAGATAAGVLLLPEAIKSSGGAA